jgi:hypothetical protein
LRWQDAHASARLCPDGALWHDAHLLDEGCECVQVPALRWHEAHETTRLCPAGGVWHEAQSFEVWRKTAFANATEGLWQIVHAPGKCFAGRTWHDAQSGEAWV